MAAGSPHTHRRRVRWLPRAPTTGQGGFEGHGGRVVPPRPSRTHSTVSEQVRDAPGWRGGPTPRLCSGRTGCGAQAGELLRARSPATGPVPLWRRTPRPSSCWTWPAVKTWAGVPASATCRARLEYRRASQRLPPQPSRCKGASGSVAPSPHPIGCPPPPLPLASVGPGGAHWSPALPPGAGVPAHVAPLGPAEGAATGPQAFLGPASSQHPTHQPH
jgi:hypothetical protein